MPMSVLAQVSWRRNSAMTKVSTSWPVAGSVGSSRAVGAGRQQSKQLVHLGHLADPRQLDDIALDRRPHVVPEPPGPVSLGDQQNAGLLAYGLLASDHTIR